MVLVTRASLALAAVLAAFGPARPAEAQWVVTNLHPSGALSSTANGVGGGQQVGYSQLGPTVGHFRASLWTGTAGSWINLHPPGTDYSICYDAEAGTQVGEVYIAGFPHASLWTGTAASWIDLHPVGSSNSSVFAVSGGQQVGRTSIGYYRAALWSGTPGSWVDLNPPPTGGYTHSSEAFGVAAGRQVGYVVNVGGVTSASLWSGTSAWVNLHPAGNISSWAYGTDGVQQVGVVRVPDTSSHAALWSGSAASWIDLYPVATTNSRATDVAGGQQVGYAQVSGQFHASLWTGTAASRVDLHAFLPASFLNSFAESITIEGGFTHVAGRGFNNATFREEALLWSRQNPVICRPDLTTSAVPGSPGYGVPNGALNNDDFFYYLAAFAAGNIAVADLTASAVPGSPGYGIPDGILNNDDFFYYLAIFAAGC